MNKVELVKSKVVFDELSHTYDFLGAKLSGITSLLHLTARRTSKAEWFTHKM